MKFIKDHMASIDGIAIYPVISLSIFFVFFVALFWWVLTARKEYIKEVSEFPLDNQDNI
ncbi:CcoQ/FixQ family Cbb3-type cytochrome c oxidase assembly chaperone [Robertkochia aurantiaca]|uniref:CcoQ/FixQ family Cbb3-type cytochrome c oxidase assembly chaperone n=1 Tax=Robertkochia aurantiaca TaxID=2873700 RepID=UPI001CC9CF21|nr:CcoQ/FixQ family Cbb3-type cytochrome c oxidase assembly chaperone [Robertkochia sp. 3YJGBD-33]